MSNENSNNQPTMEERMSKLEHNVQALVNAMGNNGKGGAEEKANKILSQVSLGKNEPSAEDKAQPHINDLQQHVINAVIEAGKSNIRRAKRYGNTNRIAREYDKMKEQLIDLFA